MTDVAERVKTCQQFINGEWVDSASGETLEVESGYGKDQSMYAVEDYTVVKHVMLKI